MVFSGAWKQAQTYTDPPERLVAIDPAHQVTDATDPYAFAYHAPPGVDFGSYPEIVGAEYVIDTPGLVLDVTPDDHDEGGHFGSYHSDLEMATVSAVDHERGFGGANQHVYGPPPMQFDSERYLGTRFETPDVPGPDPIVLQRGLNGLEQNNPGLESYGGHGFRRGWVEQSWVDRKFAVGERVHDARALTPNTAWMPANQPAPEQGNAYTSPFDSLARQFSNIWQNPMIRREPPAMDDTAATDGSDEPSPVYDLWVLG